MYAKRSPQQLPRPLAGQLLALGRIKLTRQGDLQLRVGAAIRTFMRIGSHPERVRIGAGELRHIAGFDQLLAAALLVLAIACNVLRVRRCGRRLARL